MSENEKDDLAPTWLLNPPVPGDAGDSARTLERSRADPEPNRFIPPRANSEQMVVQNAPPGGECVPFGSKLVWPGEMLVGPYRFERTLGVGGMGRVLLVHDTVLKMPRAMKLIANSHSALDSKARDRLEREAQVMAQLEHEHAVRVLWADVTGNPALIVMEYIQGITIREYLDRQGPGPQSLEWTTRILEQLCAVLHKAHSSKLGIIHRDLKPENLMLVDGYPNHEPFLKVLDFGIARLSRREQDAFKAGASALASRALGTPQYCSPEQAKGEPADHPSSDIYSVGVILYEFLTGLRPYESPDSPMLEMIKNADPTVAPPPFAQPKRDRKVPHQLEMVVLRCLAKNPALRPASAMQLAEMWDEALRFSLGRRAPRFAVPGPAGTRESAYSEPAPDRSSPAPVDPVGRSRPGKALRGLGIVVLGTLALSPISLAPVRAFLMRASALVRPGGSQVVATAPSVRVGGTDVGAHRTPNESDGAMVSNTGAGNVERPQRHRFPMGYLAEAGVGLTQDHWPRVIVRERDRSRFIRIDGGTFAMGHLESPSDEGLEQNRKEYLTYNVMLLGYYVQETEVTNGEIDDYLRDNRTNLFQEWRKEFNRIALEIGPEQARRHPATTVSWEEADEYARFVQGQLPTEAQWEFAARSGGKPYRYVWGNTDQPDPKMANIEWSALEHNIATASVKSYARDRTEQGIYDLTGNVQEWCRDLWVNDSAADPNKSSGATGLNRTPSAHVIRGNSFNGWVDECETTRRGMKGNANDRARKWGFRVVIEVSDPPGSLPSF